MSPSLRRIEDLETIESPFNTITVRRRGRWIDLDVEGATYASYHPDRLLTGYSWDALAAGSVLSAAGEPERILLLGLGGGTCLRQLRALLPRTRFTAVEIDPGVVDLARRYMGLADLDVEVIVDDAYRVLDKSRARYDVVIDDLYLTGADDVYRTGVPEGATLDKLARRLRDGGVVVANLITDVGHMRERRLARTAFKRRFDEVRVVKPPRGLNEILVGGASLLRRDRVDMLADRFADVDDRTLWRRLSVRQL